MTDVLDLPKKSRARAAPAVPPLHNGDHLDREEFHRRYAAMGEGVRAELIEGVVYMHDGGMPSPVSLDKHGTPHIDLSTWVGLYCAKTPGLLRGSDSSVFADSDNEPQPDVLLGIPESAGGRTRTIDRNGKLYVANAPELVAEVAASTASIDLNAKLRAYQRNEVQEYVVVLTEQDPPEVRWLAAENGRFSPIEVDAADGLHKSRVFPGLWLDADALLAGDLATIVAALERGCATDQHAAFARQIAGNRVN